MATDFAEVEVDRGLESLIQLWKSDEKIARECCGSPSATLDIELDLCPNADTALRKITGLRLEGIIADLSDNGAINVLVLHSARSARCNQQAIAVAIVERAVGLEAVFEIGADFSLSKPVSSEWAKSSFRAGGHK